MRQADSSVWNPLLRVVVVWLWVPVGLLLVGFITSVLLNIDLASAFKIYDEQRYLTVYVEIVSVGLIPLLFTVACKDDVLRYGVRRRGFLKSLLPSLMFVAAVYGFSFFNVGQLISFEAASFDLQFPWNLWYAALGVFAYGPLEVFFVIWLIANTDQIFRSRNGRSFKGLIITVVLFGLFHILMTRSVINALNVGITFLFLCLVYRYTDNFLGPMVAWTLINGQVFLFASILLS